MTKEITEQEWLSLLGRIYTNDSYNRVTTTKVTVKKSVINEDAIISIPLDKLKELHDNMIMNGFSDTAALVITAQVAANARATI